MNTNIVKHFPDGHFYSPINSPSDVNQQKLEDVFVKIDYNHSNQLNILNEMKDILINFNYSDHKIDDSTYYLFNDLFGWMDARSLFYFIIKNKPNNIIEIGSGQSTLLMNDVNQRFFNGKINIVCIEPYPSDYLLDIKGITLIKNKVQDIDLKIFDILKENDILFIDSSHVVKSQSDVLLYYTVVFPNINTGVNIHIHDIFLPDDYNFDWITTRHWNEQYMLYAFLLYNNQFEVLFGSNYVFKKCNTLLKEVLSTSIENTKHGMSVFGGGSFWIKRK